MIIAEKIGHVKTSDVTTTSFSIKASRKAFEILSSGLYSDKVKAIIRELSTNAADSHIAAGVTRPFSVHLPNWSEPWFAVTDYGVGLSAESLTSIYTTYFDSDKTESNEFTGCLGLGSKSPFSYTDSFTVESRHNGRLHVYTAYLDDHGMPSIARMDERETTETNGVTVKFPVKSGDFNEFCNKATEVYEYFSQRPVVNRALNYREHTYLRRTSTYGVTPGQQVVVMGNVAYPIECPGLSANAMRLLAHGVELYASIGDVEVSASREKLSYNKATIKWIQTALDAAYADLSANAVKDVASAPSLWAAREALYNLNRSGLFKDLTATYNGESITYYIKLDNEQVNNLYRKTRRTKLSNLTADGNKIYYKDATYPYERIKASGDTQVRLITTVPPELVGVAIPLSSLPAPERARNNTRKKSKKARIYKYIGHGHDAVSFWEPSTATAGVYVTISHFRWKGTHPRDLKYYVDTLSTLGVHIVLHGIREKDAPPAGWVKLEEYVKDVLIKKDYSSASAFAEYARNASVTYRSSYRSLLKIHTTGEFGKFTESLRKAESHRVDPAVKAWDALRSWVNTPLPKSIPVPFVFDKYPMLKHVTWSESSDFIRDITTYIEGI